MQKSIYSLFLLFVREKIEYFKYQSKHQRKYYLDKDQLSFRLHSLCYNYSFKNHLQFSRIHSQAAFRILSLALMTAFVSSFTLESSTIEQSYMTYIC